jgi:uncharacterized membrane protein
MISAVMRTVAQSPHLPEQAAENSTAHVQKFQHGVPWRDARPIIGPATSGPHLSYFGGPVISNVHVVQVLYGSGTYDPQVAGTTSPTMGNFYSDLLGTNSLYTNFLSQYDTNISGGTNQIIGNGTFDGLFQIVPTAANNGSTIDDSQIQSELFAQINAGHLPAPLFDAAGNVNTLYMIYFPLGTTITQGGSTSCVPFGFCAYHSTTSSTLNGKSLLYGVHPNLQSGACAQGCGSGSTPFDNYTSVTSHELSEVITDADVGIATVFGPPLAWYDMVDNEEIGDLCNGDQGIYTANGTSYVIQLEFSNADSACVLPPPLLDFSLSASPSSVSVNQGSSAGSTLTVTDLRGFTGSVTLSADGFQAGVTVSFGTNPTTSTSTVTFTASSTATTGSLPVRITGTSGTLLHTITISLTVNPTVVGDFSISPNAPTSQTVTAGTGTSYGVTVTGSGGFTGNVTLSASGLPSGASASFSPNPVTGGSGSSTMSVTTNTSTPAGTYTVTITGSSPGLTHSTTVTLVVNTAPKPDFTISASPTSVSVNQSSSSSSSITVTDSGGFTGSVTLSASGLPSGVTASFGTNPTISTSSVTFTASSTATTGTTNVTITGTSGLLSHTTTISLTVNATVVADFSIAAPTPTSQTVTAGNDTSYGVTVTGSGGFTGSVTLSASGLPPGANASFSPNPVTGGSGSSTMSVTTNTSTPAGTYTVTITGSSPGLTHSTTVTLVVNPAPQPDFTLSASPSTLTVTRGSTGSYTVTIAGVNGFAGSVSLSVSGLGSRVTTSFSPGSVTGSGSSTLTITVARSATRGKSTLTITGTSGALSHSTTAALTIQ